MTSDSQYGPALVGDVGGTNARFAIADLSDPGRPKIRDLLHLPSADYVSLNDALQDYLTRLRLGTMPLHAMIAVAGPVTDGEVILTNLSWHASEKVLETLGFAEARLINDFRALAASADSLHDEDLVAIGPQLRRVKDATVAIVGAGTGFGSSALVCEPGKAIALAGEGGHVGFSPEDETEIEILKILRRRFGRVSIERIVSGPGLVHLYEALAEIGGAAVEFRTPPEILAAAGKGHAQAHAAVNRFCAIFGAAAGDLALCFGARGGVLIGGGLSEAMTDFLKASEFRARFEGKGRLGHFVREIPTHMIVREDAALLGCARLAVALEDSLRARPAAS
jgi:glucokinase